jgi:hypothetical protein
MIGRPGRNISWSLSNAMMLPENVTPPMSPEMPVATSSVVVGACPVTSASAAPATSAEAPPPKPLSSATICGIAVIWIFRAPTAPIVPPTSMAAAIIAIASSGLRSMPASR